VKDGRDGTESLSFLINGKSRLKTTGLPSLPRMHAGEHTDD
jgi:hypothetical protein